MPKKSRKCLESVSGPGTPKSLQNVPQHTKKKTLSRHFPETLRRLAGVCPRLFQDFWGFQRQRLRETFSRLFRPGGPRETTVRGGLVPNLIRLNRPALRGGMDWWNGHFPESEKYFSEPTSPKKSRKVCRKGDFHQISGSES